MARKVFVSSRKVVPQGSASKDPRGKGSSESSSGAESQLKEQGQDEQQQQISSETSSSGSGESSDSEEEEKVIVPGSTPRGKQLRLNISETNGDSSSSESYASIASSGEEDDEKLIVEKAKPILPTIVEEPVVVVDKQQQQPKKEKEKDESVGKKKKKTPVAAPRRCKRVDLQKYNMSNHIRQEVLLLASTTTNTTSSNNSDSSKRKRPESELVILEPKAKKPKDFKTMDPKVLRQRSDELMKEARELKHLGDREYKTDSKKRGECYLKSSLKFFEYAIVLADVKEVYKAQGDEVRAKQFSEGAKRMLPQTASLIEVAARSFSSVKDTKLTALSYKFAAIVYMYIFRTQRTKLEAIHREVKGALSKTKQDSSPSLTLNGMGHGTFDAYMKETSNIFKGFDLWQRYERHDSTVLSCVSDLATADVNHVIDALKKVI